MKFIAVLLNEDGEILSAYGLFLSEQELRTWAESSVRRNTVTDYWRYQIVRLVGVTEDKGEVGPC